jgi:hypothetical protein
LAALDFTLATLAHELKQLAEFSQEADLDDSAAVVREAAATSRILELLARGERLASGLADKQIAGVWQRVAASAGKARLLAQGPHRATKLAAAAADCEALQQIIEEKLNAV